MCPYKRMHFSQRPEGHSTVNTGLSAAGWEWSVPCIVTAPSACIDSAIKCVGPNFEQPLAVIKSGTCLEVL